MAYATAAQLLERYDARDIGDLVSDDDTPVPRPDLLTDGKVAAALNDASGAIDSALMVGGLYSAADLAGLTGNSQYRLICICCEIAMARLFSRRPLRWQEAYAKALELAEGHLDKLRCGQNTFGLPAQIAAGLPSIDGPTTLEYQALNLVRDRTKNYFPGRRLPNNR